MDSKKTINKTENKMTKKIKLRLYMLVGQQLRLQLRQKWPAPGLRLQHPGCNVTMEMSYYQKINFHKNDLKSYLLRHINTAIAHKHLILLK